MYDLLIVGSGLFGATCAYEAVSRGKKVLVLEKRDHIGGNIYTEKVEGIDVHRYGAHIFHTSDKKIWDFINRFSDFNSFINSPVANYKGEIYNLPFNMNTFSKMFGVATPAEAKAVLKKQCAEIKGEPENLEEQAISLVGRDIYTKLIKGYTEKQWNRDCKDLPAFIIKRLPVRFTYDNNYFNDRFQGIPVLGYTKVIEKMLEGAEVRTGVNFLDNKENYLSLAKQCIYTGPIDEYFGFSAGKLEYRSLRFETEILNEDNHQGVAVVNYTEREIPYTRVIEHKHFNYVENQKTVITKEYPTDWKEGLEPYYPVNNGKNNELYKLYAGLAEKEPVLFGGRLAEYRYYDMDDTIDAAWKLIGQVL
ncbi:MAG: UDP-galactopyranose mutase [Clostridia bacterium]|nr:UDP-galactopyranose mutase [Clostridia bacterium]